MNDALDGHPERDRGDGSGRTGRAEYGDLGRRRDRTDRGERDERGNRTERDGRDERSDRSLHRDWDERSDRSMRRDRDERGDRADRGDQARRGDPVSRSARMNRADGAGRLDQVVFRWDGNRGRASSGMTAVAYSCSAERADALCRDLGPLLWVPDSGAAPRPSSVRVVPRGEAAVLLQRWPTLDRGGRPSSACHAVIGNAELLTPRLCLGLGGSAWSKSAVTETATGELSPPDVGRLRTASKDQLDTMTAKLATVEEPLTVAVAELLRNPSRRLSLLAREDELPGWPRRNTAPLLYLGLLAVFGDWIGTPWSYATYDTVDTHPLLLTCVPEWTSQAAGAGSPARVRLRPPAERDVESAAAEELVAYVLDQPGEHPGVPHLGGELLPGARMRPEERREALRRMLRNARQTPPRRPALPRGQEPDGRYGGRAEDRPEGGRHGRREDSRRVPPPQTDRRYSTPYEDRPTPTPYEDLQTPAPPTPYEDRRTPAPHADRRAPAPYEDRRPSYSPADREEEYARERRRLRQELQVHQSIDTTQTDRLAARLRNLPDAHLLPLLRTDELPRVSRDLVLDELADPDRRQSRDGATARALCTEVLRHNLYFRPARREPDDPSTAEMRERSAALFSWAVAPLVRDPDGPPDLGPLFNIFVRGDRAGGVEWVRRTLVAPPGGVAPDLPPQLWQQIVRELIDTPAPAPPPAPAPTPASPPPTPAPTPAPPSTAAPAAAPAPAPPPEQRPAAPAPPPSSAVSPPSLPPEYPAAPTPATPYAPPPPGTPQTPPPPPPPTPPGSARAPGSTPAPGSAPPPKPPGHAASRTSFLSPKPTTRPATAPPGPAQDTSDRPTGFLYGRWFVPVVSVLAAAVVAGLVVLFSG
ncbi:hypothetical protein ACIQ9M_25385 [Streptomyces californicus]|uniref:hypothetical protein n=1 Tax=Streptomyces californicus TaxID=67351 RepID=UPI0036763E2D